MIYYGLKRDGYFYRNSKGEVMYFPDKSIAEEQKRVLEDKFQEENLSVEKFDSGGLNRAIVEGVNLKSIKNNQ